MDKQDNFWQIQDPQKPLFEDLIWSRPENKALAGKILIIGGNAHGFSEVASAYAESAKAGAGSIKILLPDVLKKVVGKSLDNAYFSPSTPSGSFAKRALDDLSDYSTWANIVLLAGNFGRNSETSILIESFIDKYKSQLTISNDALDYFTPNPINLLAREKTLLIATLAELQKLSIKLNPENIIKFEMSLVQLAEALRQLSLLTPNQIITKHLDNILVAVKGKVSTTKLNQKFEPWRVGMSAYSSVWLMQNPGKPFEALSSAVVDLIKDKYSANI
jgi:NAD(P)H-hydrate repair Nnr-like enzyme with NAD(P)H-hydrate dehydratase domain